MEDELPKIVITVVVSLMILGVGVFAFYVLNSEIGFSETQVEIFPVSNPSVAKECQLTHSMDHLVSVEQYDGYSWHAIGASDYTVAGKIVTVLPSGMTG